MISCLPSSSFKLSYLKRVVIVLVAMFSVFVYIRMSTNILEDKVIAGMDIAQVTPILAILSIGLNLFFLNRYYLLHKQIKREQRLVCELYQQRDFDMLSGVKNRNAFTRFAQQIEKEEARVSVMVCDIDGLKIINDTMGHLAGDTIVRKAAEMLKASLCGDAQLFRIGGDEYIIVFKEFLTEEKLWKFKNLIKERIAGYNVQPSSIPLSMSIGFATASTENRQFWSVVKQADSAMYQEKRSCKEKVYRNLRASLVE